MKLKILRCSHCKSELNDADFGSALLSLTLTPIQAFILRRLIAERGAPVHLELLTFAAYGHRINGGPLNAEKYVRRCLYILKHRAKAFNYTVTNIRGFGYRLERLNIIQLHECKAA